MDRYPMHPNARPLLSPPSRQYPSRAAILPSLALLFALAIPLSCSTTGQFSSGGEISKVKITQVDPNRRITAADRAILMEQRYRLHGAIDGAERSMVAGNYYDVFWHSADRSQPVTVLFEYRTKTAGMEPSAQELLVEQPDRRNISTFTVVGEELLAGQGVTSWRASLIQGGRTIATSQSHLWD